jgi:hypothetical protein
VLEQVEFTDHDVVIVPNSSSLLSSPPSLEESLPHGQIAGPPHPADAHSPTSFVDVEPSPTVVVCKPSWQVVEVLLYENCRSVKLEDDDDVPELVDS